MGLRVTGDKQRSSWLICGALEWVKQRGPTCGLGRSDHRVKALCPAPGRGLAAPGGVAGGRAHVCRSCGWAGPGRETRAETSLSRPSPCPEHRAVQGSGCASRLSPGLDLFSCSPARPGVLPLSFAWELCLPKLEGMFLQVVAVQECVCVCVCVCVCPGDGGVWRGQA